MAFNKGREERKWKRWKEAEEKILRDCGVNESTIEQLRIDDWAIFNSDRRFYSKLREVGTYLDTVAESEQKIEVSTIGSLLDEIEDEQLYQVLRTVDKRTLQIILLKTQGYSTREISSLVDLTTGAIYARLDHLRKKLKQFKR